MKRTIAVGIMVLLVVAGGAGFWLYQRVLGETAAPSGPISAVPLATDATAAGALRLQIVPEKSSASFTISEVLRGNPTTVVGKTNQVAGEIAVDPNDLSTTKVGAIRISARALATDTEQRNRAIRNFILSTNDHEFITFTPTAVKGLSGKAELNKPLTFQIAGDLTIRDVTKPVVFDVTARADMPTSLSGTASATINRADFNLTIPDVPFVANVGEQVKLDLDFMAEAGQG